MRKTQRNEIGAGIIVTILGCSILAGACFLAKETIRFVRNSYEVKATVVSVQEHVGRDSSRHRKTTYSPRVRFATREGGMIEEQAPWYSGRRYKHGQSLALLAERNAPYSFKEKGFGSVWGFTGILFFIGIGCSLVGLTVITTAILKEKRNNANTAPQSIAR
jgi:hypothetical protein